jgi:endoglucanase
MQKDESSRSLEILEELGKQPATSYFEAAVARRIEAFLQEVGIPYEADRYGNIVAHYETPGGLAASQPPVALVAHMDHPGFEVLDAPDEQGLTRAQMLGRTPDAVYTQRIPLLVFSVSGGIARAWTIGRGGDPDQRRMLIEMERRVALPAYAVFDLSPFMREGDLAHMRACDDLAGCAATLSVLERLQRAGTPANVYGVFTRAEEEGLVGARLLAAERRLPMETIVVSVESSRSLPGAEHGKGPIIRVGDAATTFSLEAEAILLFARQKLAERRPPAAVQRQLMSGGVCEASAFVLHGYRATGVAFPLGHYHNGFGEAAVEAEFIDVNDFLGGVDLLLEAVRATATEGTAGPPAYARIRAHPEAEARRLEATRGKSR